MTHRYPRTVVSSDLDELGHVNNARYLEYLEEARMDWYAQESLVEHAAAALGDLKLGTVVVNINIDFRAECMVDDVLHIDTVPSRAGRKSYAVSQWIFKANGELAAEASVTSVIMDLVARRAVALPAAIKTLFDAA